MPYSCLHQPVLDWYAHAARDLPWRAPDVSAWGVLVSEVMLQQTPVSRVLPAYVDWLARWPTPQALAASPPGEAVRQWGTLGYPRRALRLHAAAVMITDLHDGRVPSQVEDLRRLPGVGVYTAAAVASFAFQQRHAVVDTNVARVLARAVGGGDRARAQPGAEERRQADDLLPDDPAAAARWAVALMGLGALVCVARAARCQQCPIAPQCRWRATGGSTTGAPRTSRSRSYAGTDRQCRGRLLGVLRASDAPVPAQALAASWDDPAQRARALGSLVSDGLVEPLADGRFRLPA